MNDTFPMCGKMFIFTSQFAKDLEEIKKIECKIIGVDTKKEAIELIRRIRGMADHIEREIKKAGTDYMLKEVD